MAHFWDSKLTVELVAGPHFQKLGLRLKPGNVVRFEGSLSTPSLGGLKPEVRVTALDCVSCDPSMFPNEEGAGAGAGAGAGGKEQDESCVAEFPWEVGSIVLSTLQGTADFVLPHFIRLNVTQLWMSNMINY